MEDEDPDTSPFWLQSGQSYRRRRHHSGFLIILLVLTALAFIFFIIPSFLSITSQVLRPNLVKKSWDKVNLALVLVAIVFGFFSRSSSSSSSSSSSGDGSTRSYDAYKFSRTVSQDSQKSNPVTPHRWYADRTGYSSFARLRSSSSYPDLRLQESSWTVADDPWRFYDDTHLYNYRVSTAEQFSSRPRQEVKEEGGDHYNKSKDIQVDTFVTQTEKQVLDNPPPSAPTEPPSPPHAPSSPPPPPPQKAVKRKTKRTYQDIAVQKDRSSDEAELGVKVSSESSSAPPPVPPPPPPPPLLYEKSIKGEKKRGGTTKDFLTSLRRKKKKQRQKSIENLEAIFYYPQQPTLLPPPSPPPPPPPPLPAPFFQNFFSSKKGKSKKIHSVPPPPPPPPPPLPVSFHSRASETRSGKSETRSQKAPIPSQEPALPVKLNKFNRGEESTTRGNEYPLIPIPPPPPPPPFKMPAWKFVVQGDYVRLASISSSRSGSPDLDEVEEKNDSISGGDTSNQLFCPSPDVNTKADNFIARFRAGLKLEKMNSVKEKGKSKLGPEGSPSPGPDLSMAMGEDT